MPFKIRISEDARNVSSMAKNYAGKVRVAEKAPGGFNCLYAVRDTRKGDVEGMFFVPESLATVIQSNQ